MEDQCNRNNTIELTTENESEYLYSTSNKLFLTVGMPLISTFGILNQLAFLFVLYRVKRMRTTMNFYLGNLAFSDMGYLITACTYDLWAYFVMEPVEFRRTSSSGFGCSAPLFVIFALYRSSVFLVTIVTAERYFAICHPMTHRRINTRGRAVKLILISWTLSFTLALFALNSASIETTCMQFPKDSHQPQVAGQLLVFQVCIFRCNWCWNAAVFIDMIQFILALFVSLVMHLMIVKNLSKRGEDLGRSSDNTDKDTSTQVSMLQARNAVARMLTVNSLVFFVCFLPYQIFNIHQIVLLIGGTSLISNESLWTLFLVGTNLTFINASVNPFIYGVTNSRYRIAYFEAFKCRSHATKNAQMNSLSHISGTVNTTD